MADFILVHGGLHGASCWDLLRPELERAGHRCFAMDLPIDQPNVWMDDYAEAALAAVDGIAADNAYLVGHSMGGMVIPRMVAQRPNARLIFLCAGFAHSNEAEHAEGLDATRRDFFSKLTIDGQGNLTMTAENAIALFYQDVEPELAKWAVSTLRPQWHESFAKVGPVAPYAERVAHVIYTTEDEIIDPAKHRRMAEKRFGIKPIALPGGHSPFLSHPVALADLLNRIVVADMAGERYAPN